jgi:excisionase family DNA binding protein
MDKKPAGRETVPLEQRLLVNRRNAAQYLSISQRSLDYLLANGDLNARRIGTRVLIPISELQRYARVDYPKPIATPALGNCISFRNLSSDSYTPVANRLGLLSDRSDSGLGSH